MTDDSVRPEVGVRRLEVVGFRSARHTVFAPQQMCALVGEARAGKSTVLEAMRAVLDPNSRLRPEDVSAGGSRLSIRAELTTGAVVSVEGPPFRRKISHGDWPVVLFLAAAARATSVISSSVDQPVIRLFEQVLADHIAPSQTSTTSAALGLVEAIERCCTAQANGLVVLIEEPELYLRPQAQRYLYRLLRRLAANGNQVVYSTHSPTFLNVARLDELAFVNRAVDGSQVLHPPPVASDEEFKAMSEFDAERSEVFLAQAAILVEGTTEKLALPFVFRALGLDPDELGITIVECGGKAGIPFFARICRAVGVPFVALHDRDAPHGDHPIAAEDQLNRLIAELAGPEQDIVLVPDFEAVAGITGRGHKPRRAWRRFTALAADAMPQPLLQAVRLSHRLAREPQTEGPTIETAIS